MVHDGEVDDPQTILNAVSPVVDHGHNVGEVEALYHHLHEDFITASASHKLLQRELACQTGKTAHSSYKPSFIVLRMRTASLLFQSNGCISIVWEI